MFYPYDHYDALWFQLIVTKVNLQRSQGCSFPNAAKRGEGRPTIHISECNRKGNRLKGLGREEYWSMDGQPTGIMGKTIHA